MSKKNKIVSSKKDNLQIQDGVYIMNNNVKNVENKSTSQIVYTMIGNHNKLIDDIPILITKNNEKDIYAYAYEQTSDNITKFFIRLNGNNKLFNPILDHDNKTIKSKILGQHETNKYIRVNETCFKLYLEFLKTKRITSYKFAERERV